MHQQMLFASLAGVTGYTIENAAVFDGNDYLSRTPGGAGNSKSFTISAWVKRGDLGREQIVWAAGDWNNAYTALYFTSADKLNWEGYHGASNFDIKLQGSDLFRDPGAWYSIICVYDSTPSTPGSSHCKLIVNGTQLTNFVAEAYPAQNEDSVWNTTVAHSVGFITTNGGTRHIQGYIADVHAIDGAALSHTDFGEVDDNGVWTPIEYTGSYGTNGFHLDFAVATGTGNGAGTDVSGAGNHLSDSGDPTKVTDAPTDKAADNIGNYCTGNPSINATGTSTFAQGNNDVTLASFGYTGGTILFDAGDMDGWYWEVTLRSGSGSDTWALGIIREDAAWNAAYLSAETAAKRSVAYKNGTSGQIW